MREHHRVVVVGSGFAGLGMAVALKRAGIEDFVVLERADSLGGTWRDNHYPGCGCDVPTPLYSFSFAPNPRWSRFYAKRRGDPRLPGGRRRPLRPPAATCASAPTSPAAAGTRRAARWVGEINGEPAMSADFVDRRLRRAEPPGVPGHPRARGLRAAPVFHSAAVGSLGPARGPAGRRDRHRRQRDPARPAGGQGRRQVTVFQRTPPWVVPKLDRPIPAARAGALRPGPGHPARGARRRVRGHRGRRRRHHPRAGADADRRGVEPAAHAPRDRRPRAAGEAHARATASAASGSCPPTTTTRRSPARTSSLVTDGIERIDARRRRHPRRRRAPARRARLLDRLPDRGGVQPDEHPRPRRA